MKTLNITGNDLVGVERISRRVVNGVEIIERETMKTIQIDADPNVNRSNIGAPRLLIDEAISASKLIIAKTRSDFRELDSFLRGIVSPGRQEAR